MGGPLLLPPLPAAVRRRSDVRGDGVLRGWGDAKDLFFWPPFRRRAPARGGPWLRDRLFHRVLHAVRLLPELRDQPGELGKEISCDDLARIMVRLQERGCHNINFVTPTHFVPQIVRSVSIAAEMGLCIPLVYNTGTYDSLETLQLLDGIFDIYMPDAKYGESGTALLLSDAPRYVETMQEAIVEMQRQVGDLVVEGGIAKRGLLIRHLVLPGDLAESRKVFAFIAERVSKDAYVNIMDQYRPSGRVADFLTDPRFGVLNRGLTEEEFDDAVASARRAGLHRGIPLG